MSAPDGGLTRPARSHRAPGGAAVATVARLARREWGDHRRRTAGFGLLFAAVAVIQPISYRRAYPTLAERIAFARSFGANEGLRLMYGRPQNLLTVGGYTAWRTGQVLAVLAGVWAVLAASDALRGEEDAGRAQTVLALPVSRADAIGGSMTALALEAAAIGTVLVAGLLVGGLAAGGSILLAASIVSTGLVFGGITALAAQLAGSRRRTRELALGVLIACFLARVIADTATGLEWLRWASPMGWVEEIGPFAHARPWLLAIPVIVAALACVVSVRLALRRDIGTGILASSSAHPPHRRGLGSVVGWTVREEAPALGAWALGLVVTAVLIGLISPSVSSISASPGLRRALARAHESSILQPAGYLSFTFIVFVFVLGLLACAQVAAARREELEGRLQTLLAAGTGRAGWLSARLAVALGGACVIAAATGVAAWAGARIGGVDVTLGGLLLAAVNGVAVAALFGGIGALLYAALPRASSAAAYGLSIVLFLWQLFGEALGAPQWLLDVSPFAHLGLAPSHTFRLIPVLVLAAIGAAAAGAAAAFLRRRDLLCGG